MNRFVTFLCVFVVVLGLAQLPSEMPWALRILVIVGASVVLGFVLSKFKKPETQAKPKKERIVRMLRVYAVFLLFFAVVMPSIWDALAICAMFALGTTMFIIWAPDNAAESSTLANTIPGLIFLALVLAATCIFPDRRDLWWLSLALVALGAGIGHVAWLKLRWRPERSV